MSEAPKELRYTKSHEWVRLESGDVATVGITAHAQSLLGDLVFVELPEVGAVVDATDEVAVVESVKAASDVYSPIGGKVTECNTALQDNPDLINKDPYGEGWIFKIKCNSKEELQALLDADAYLAIASED